MLIKHLEKAHIFLLHLVLSYDAHEILEGLIVLLRIVLESWLAGWLPGWLAGWLAGHVVVLKNARSSLDNVEGRACVFFLKPIFPFIVAKQSQKSRLQL